MLKNKNTTRKYLSNPWLRALFVLVVLGLVLLVLEIGGVTNFWGQSENDKESQYTSTGQQTKGETQEEKKQTNSESNPPSDNEKGTNRAKSSVVTNGGAPKTPSGTFVSNHYPNLDGSPAPNKVSSTCVTTPGASCTISFSKGSVTKTLEQKKTDSEGVAYWTWKLQDLGLTVGTWKITAKATLNGQTKTASDALNLNVGS